jgi:hypothetical protein
MENQIKITKENAIASVQSSVSSIFSKEDVLFLINSIEQEPTVTKPTLNITSVISDIMNELEDMNDRGYLLELSDAELELYGDRIEVTSVPVDFDRISNCIEEILINVFDQESEEDINNNEL